MNDRLLLGTRKGFFDLRRSKDGWTIANKAFVGEPVSMLLRDPHDGAIYAALNLGHFGVKLHRSEDDGATWRELPAPAIPKVETDDAEAAKKAPSVSLIWALESAGKAGALWAGTIPGGLFRSDDRGESWTLNNALWNQPSRPQWFGGGYDQPGIHSICVDPRDANRILAGVSCAGAWLTEDGGKSWRQSAHGMIAEFMPPDEQRNPDIQDPHRIVQSPSSPDILWTQHHNGVFRSDNGGTEWHEIAAIKPAKFGFAVAVHPNDAKTAWFVPGVKDECRVPVDGALAVARTRDGGKSFEVLRAGLPQQDAYDLIYRHGLAVDETGQRLAMGSTTGHLWVSDDGGDNWRLTAGNLPPIACVRFA